MGHVERMGEKLNVFGGEPQGNRPFEDVGIDGIISLKWILKKCDEKTWT
jgi:hypothetical protein